MSKLFIYDLETTGTDHKQHAIHQISGIIVINGVKKQEFDFKVAPHASAVIDEDAIKVSNVTKEQIMTYPANILVHRQLLGLLGKYVNKFAKTDKFHLLGYNNKGFDNDFFRTFFNLCGDTYYGSWFWADSIDALVLASDYLQDERSKLLNFQLRTVAAHLGIPVDETKLHDAQYDIYLTYEIYKIVSHKKEVEKPTFEENMKTIVEFQGEIANASLGSNMMGNPQTQLF